MENNRVMAAAENINEFTGEMKKQVEIYEQTNGKQGLSQKEFERKSINRGVDHSIESKAKPKGGTPRYQNQDPNQSTWVLKIPPKTH